MFSRKEFIFAFMKYYAIVFLCALFLGACDETKNVKTEYITVSPELEKINKKIGETPDKADLYFQRGQLYRSLEMDSMALRDYDQAMSLDTTKSYYFSAVGDLLFDKKDISGSVKWFQKAISINPNDEIAHLKIANIFLYSKEYPKAFAQINTVLQQNVYNAEAYFLKGMCYKDMGDLDKALSSFQTAVQTEPKYYDGFMQLGLLYTKKNDPLALQYFENAIRVDSLNTEAHYAKAMYYQTQRKYKEAKEVFKRALRINMDYTEAHYNIGWMLLQQDSAKKALREFERVLTTRPDYAKAYYNKGLCHEILGEFELAKADYEQALVFDPAFDLPTPAIERVKKKL